MGVTVNGRFLTRPPTGVDRFAIELLRAWIPQRNPTKVKIALPCNNRTPSGHDFGVPVRHSRHLDGHAWEQIQLPSVCGDDVLLSLCNTSPVLRKRQLVVLHDA